MSAAQPVPAPEAAPEIRLSGLRKSFGTKVVLDGLDLAIAKGDSIVILGKSGIGKSVLLKHMIGLLSPDSGTVEIEGEDFWAASRTRRDEIRRRFGMSFQEGALFDSMSVGENIAFALKRHTRMTPDEVKARVSECLALVRLRGIESKRPSELSGGMRRRVGFARAIALKPEVLLFDEPTTGLDPITTDILARVIVDLRDRMNPTMVTITHDLKVAFEVGERVALLDGGKILVDLPPREFETSDDPRVRAFVQGDGSKDADSGIPEEATA